MKKIILLTALLSLACSLEGEAKSSSLPVHFELYSDFSDLTATNNSQMTGGLKITSPLCEFKSANRQDKSNLGLLFSTESFIKKMPFELKYGNLSCGGSLSRMNSPELSNSTSPFSTGILTNTALTANLPGYSSFSKEESIFFQMKMKQFSSSPFQLLINTWISPENSSPILSAFVSDRFLSGQLTLNASYTAGNFFYDANSSGSWFLDSPYYKSDSHFCSLCQFSAELINKNTKSGFYSAFLAAFYETPFGPYTASYRTDFKLILKKTEFFTSAFLNVYEDTLTSSEKKMKPSFQIKSGLITTKTLLTKKAHLIFLKIGTNVFSRINLTDTTHPFRINAGLQLSNEIMSTSLSFSDSVNLISLSPEMSPHEIRNEEFSIQVKNSLSLKICTPSVLISLGKKINSDTGGNTPSPLKCKLQMNISNSARHKITGSCTINFSVLENNITDKKISANLSCRFSFKEITIIGKVAFQTDL